METIFFLPKGVCSKAMQIDIEDNIIQNVRISGGCQGNLTAISNLLVGMTREEAIKRLEGITCGTKPTSCGDQLAKALHTDN